MTKFLVVALAMVAVISQANASPGERAREIKTREARELELRSRATGRVSPETKAVADAVSASNVDANLSPMQAKTLLANLNKPENSNLRDKAKEIAGLARAKPALMDLHKARIEGLLNLSKLANPNLHKDLESDLGLPQERAAQAYARLVLVIGDQAATWTPATAKQMTSALEAANTELARLGDRSNAEAFSSAVEKAVELIKKVDKNDPNFREVVEKTMKEFKEKCKKV